jgi:hypothetical protein
MNIVKQNDLRFGQTMEELAQPKLELIFGKLTNNNIRNKYHPIDFKNKLFGVEYKRRRINFRIHPTAMLNISKIEKGIEYKKRGKRVIYVWEYEDDTYYWELDDTYTKGKGGTCRRGKDEIVDVAHIENKYIKKLSDFK